ncbi:Vitamin B12 dependent methionine synthase, activation domain protein [uncultured Eubacteriales bacterium]|uniref:Vitamin B12 dependent methionine synthase, activation domain protein n=1 Tax=uncultured Eubacteriales bacterium TaxID=172733 RepID=A0A212JBY9_9FIRM|nr:Vitamin B12 dependent methionine synthase, activation domain protein [uncultured Eubacteriales bacterium]
MELNMEEALRYLGVQPPIPEDLRREACTVASRLTAALRPRFLYRVFPLVHEEGQIVLTGAGVALTGRSARKMLATCDQAALLACTLGSAFDALLRTEQARDMAKAVILDACGSAWVEAGCDEAEREISARLPGRYLTDRFSPGYGDLPLSLQPGLCTALDAPRRLGVTVTESLLLNPVKTVTAVIGLSDEPQQARIRGCAYCSMRETCALRKGGKSCAR